MQSFALPPGGVSASEHADSDTPVGTTSATFVDVTGFSLNITLIRQAKIFALATFELATISGASASVIAIGLNIDGTNDHEHQRYLSGSNDQGIGAITELTDVLNPGTYTVKLQFRRVSGVATPGINNGCLLAIAI